MREKTYVEQTPLNKSDAYDKAAVWFAKSFNNSQKVIQLSDKAAGRIIGKGNADCKYLTDNSMVRQSLHFTIDVALGDKKADIQFSDVRSVSSDGVWDMGPETKEQADKYFSECVEPIKQSLLAALK